MSFADSFANLLAGKGRGSIEVPLLPGEEELQRVIGATLFSGFSRAGGHLILTNQRLIFSPWSMQDLSVLMTAGFRLMGLPGPIASLPEAAVKLIGDPVGIALNEITDVTAGRDATIGRPPSMIVSTKTDRIEFGVLSKLFSLNISASNVAAREAFIAAVKAAVAAAKSLPGTL